ncbi:MAG: acetate uptake transporter [Nitrososphaerota archaeon]|jgi:succinate-acetate transporter protein|nr:acetate uptake transporter [Nitrososphaerota archaeon]MDG6931658.1 acetate uptake transporter [Nitrososphaerota archaeon]MDG6935619.1 acetate uptake transporter [Nitrososphaerota archaeon]MDG6943624.1 acetate uptake transporter [Nitrososphaerota archaeon]
MSNTIKKKGDPTAVGIFAYGFSLFFLSMYAMGIYPWSESIVMIAPALLFGGLFLLVAANWEYNNGNTFGATAFATYSAFFLTFAIAHIGLFVFKYNSIEVGHLVGLMAVAFTIMTVIYWIGSFRMNLALNLTLFFLLLTFILYAVPLTTLTSSMTTAMGTFPGSLKPAGYVGFIDVLFTIWVGAAAVINDRWEITGKKGPVPVFPLVKEKKQE